MTQGIRVVKEGFDITTRDPRNVALDTTAVGSLKKLPTIHIKIDPKNFTERYKILVPDYQGSYFLEFGRIRIPHDFGFPPAFLGFVMQQYQWDGILQKNVTTMPHTGLAFGSSIQMESDDREVVINGLPITPTEHWMAITIFAENLDAETV